MSYNYLPDGYIPVVEATSLLAFGDRDYNRHYQLVEVWGKPEMSPENAAEILRCRQKDIEKDKRLGLFYPEKYCELDQFGRTKKQELHFPEIKNELNRLQRLAAKERITIIALYRGGPIQPIGQRYQAIPAEFFKFNEWVFWGPPDFAIAKPYDRDTKNGGTDRAEWFYPAVALSDVHRLQAKGGRRGRQGYPFWPEARQAAMAWMDDEGCPDTLAELEKFIHRWLSEREHQAGERVVRDRARCWREKFIEERKGIN